MFPSSASHSSTFVEIKEEVVATSDLKLIGNTGLDNGSQREGRLVGPGP